MPVLCKQAHNFVKINFSHGYFFLMRTHTLPETVEKKRKSPNCLCRAIVYTVLHGIITNGLMSMGMGRQLTRCNPEDFLLF